MNQLPVIDVSNAHLVVADYDPHVSMRRHRGYALAFLAILIFGFGLAAAVVPIGGAVIGSGQLGVESRIKRIAHPSGGIISEIRVKDGDRVRRGQILMRLDTAVSGINADLSGQSVEQLLAQRARLEAERDGLSTIRFPSELTGSSNASARLAMADQWRIFQTKGREQGGLRAQLNDRINQLSQQISGYQSQIHALQQQQVLLKPEREGVRELWEKDLVTINRLNQLERTSVDMDGSIASLQAQIAQTQARISETREQIIGLAQTQRTQAGAELTQVVSALNEEQVRNASANDQFERSIIRAPYNGVVDKLAFSTLGDVITPAETIMEIVPDSDDLVVEAAISPMDIDRVRRGQRARLRLSAFNQQTTPEINGTVSFVSAERTSNKDTGASFYRVRVTLDEKEVKQAKLQLRPGMPVEAFIATGSRSMLSYITKPLRDQLSRAFRD